MKEFKNTFYYRNWKDYIQNNNIIWLLTTAGIITAGVSAGFSLIFDIIFFIALGIYAIYMIKEILIVLERFIVEKRYKANKFIIAPRGFFRVQDDAGALAIYVDTEYGTKHKHSNLIDPCYHYEEVSYYATKHHLVIIDIN